MGLISTGSVFVDVSRLLGVLQSSWAEAGAAARPWVVLAASEERECQNGLKWALSLGRGGGAGGAHIPFLPKRTSEKAWCVLAVQLWEPPSEEEVTFSLELCLM